MSKSIFLHIEIDKAGGKTEWLLINIRNIATIAPPLGLLPTRIIFRDGSTLFTVAPFDLIVSQLGSVLRHIMSGKKAEDKPSEQ